MRPSKKLFLLMVLGALTLANCQTGTAQNRKPKVVIVATGGTIAGSAESQTAAGYQSGAVGVDILIQAVPNSLCHNGVNRVGSVPVELHRLSRSSRTA